jgi:hypothetical protein
MSQEALVGGLVIGSAALVVSSHVALDRLLVTLFTSGGQPHYAVYIALRWHCVSHVPNVCVTCAFKNARFRPCIVT